MNFNVIFVGDLFIYNKGLREYALRKIEQVSPHINAIAFLKDKETATLTYFEELLEKRAKSIIVASKENFTLMGKILCTITDDNQVFEKGMLLPQNHLFYRKNSYLIEYKNAMLNVLKLDLHEEMPFILTDNSIKRVKFSIFDIERSVVHKLLLENAQKYNLSFSLVEKIDGWLEVEVKAEKYGDTKSFGEAMKDIFSQNVIFSQNMAQYIIEKLTKNKKTLTFAESCTGGSLTYFFTKENGASQCFKGSLISYANEIKEKWLAVEEDSIQKCGAVSEEVVKEMCEGAMAVANADYALAVSGIAGDGGGSEEKPVGTIYIGVKTQEHHQEQRVQLHGDRNYIQEQSLLYAVKMLLLSDKKLFFTI